MLLVLHLYLILSCCCYYYYYYYYYGSSPSVQLSPDDEFMILACDGIWDCLTNEQAVKYVRDRIDTKTPKEIGIEMLDDIISEDPRATQGIGGDNMTVMIVDLLPQRRSYS